MEILPEPLPEPPLGSDSQPALVVTVHEQFACVVSDAVSRLPDRHGVNVTGSTEYSQSDGRRALGRLGDQERVPGNRHAPLREVLPLFSPTE